MDLENMQKRVIEGSEDTLSGFVSEGDGRAIRKKDSIDNVRDGRMRKKEEGLS
jgi:hypothetical protein